jgi:hypothetical protein
LSVRGFKRHTISVRDIGWVPGADDGRLVGQKLIASPEKIQ